MKTHIIRDSFDARRLLVQGLWWQRVLPPTAATVRPVLSWAKEAASGGQALPPIGFVADLGHVLDSDPLCVVAAASEEAPVIEHNGDSLLFEDTTAGLRDPSSRDVNGVVVIPSDRLAVIDAAFDGNGFDSYTPSFGSPLPDVADCLSVGVERERIC